MEQPDFPRTPALVELRFGAAAYEAELDRAAAGVCEFRSRNS